jgi:hypothetical protein
MKFLKPLALLALLFLYSPSPVATQAPGPRTIDLALGQQDFIATPVKKTPAPTIDLTQHHQALASGDLNGDGIGDLILGGAGRIDVPPIVGQVHVVFGPMAAGGLADLSNAADVGVRLTGADVGDMFGWSVAVGDLNNDGQDDLIVGALRGDGSANGQADAGDVYVFMGPLAGAIGATSADVVVHGIDPGDFLGWSLGAGDVSGDGITDLILGARDADGFENALVGRAGEVHVLFGPLVDGTIDLAATPADVTVYGGTSDYQLGASVAAGDVTGDLVADLVMGAPRDNAKFGGVTRGNTQVLFGPLAAGTVVDLRLSDANLSITGTTNNDRLGSVVAVADISGDGIGDLITVSDIAWNLIPTSPNFKTHSGAVYALFGPLASGTHVIANATDLTVYSKGPGGVSSMATGDLNGDSQDDLMIGAQFGSALMGPPPPGSGKTAPGDVFAVFGPFSSGTITDLETTSPDIRVAGKYFSGRLGAAVAANDVTGDGIDDFLLEASFAQYPGSGIGEGYVIFGTSPNRPATTLALSPATSTRVVGHEHCVTATAGDASGNPPVPEVTVRFSVTGANSAATSSITNANGEASLCYTGTISGTDTISAFADTNGDGLHDAGEPASAAENVYLPGDPATLTLSPSSASSVVDAQHCTTAMVRDQFGNAVPNSMVSFAVTGIGATGGSAAAGANGEAAFCYASPLPGVDSISASAGGPSATATNTWVLPPSAPGCGRVHGAGSIGVSGSRAHFVLTAMNQRRGGLDGTLTYHVAHGTRFRAIDITHLIVVGKQVTVHGVGRAGHGPLVPFRVDAGDARPDTFRILWPGYAAEGAVRGKLRVRSHCEPEPRKLGKAKDKR